MTGVFGQLPKSGEPILVNFNISITPWIRIVQFDGNSLNNFFAILLRSQKIVHKIR